MPRKDISSFSQDKVQACPNLGWDNLSDFFSLTVMRCWHCSQIQSPCDTRVFAGSTANGLREDIVKFCKKLAKKNCKFLAEFGPGQRLKESLV